MAIHSVCKNKRQTAPAPTGTYQFPAMRRLAINSGDAFILVYSVDDPQSFDDLEQLRETILNEREQAYLEASGSVTSNESSSGLASGGVSQSSMITNNLTTTPGAGTHSLHPATAGADHQRSQQDLSPSRHWSLASLFSHHATSATTQQHQQHAHTNTGPLSSLSSSFCSSSSCSSSTDNSRRSSISAAEAALKTRRTRRPPMVIVANKHDLPRDRHLVNSDEIEALAVIDWNNGFVRASAALNWNIDEIFQQVLKQARQPPTLTEAIVSKRRKSLPPKLPHP